MKIIRIKVNSRYRRSFRKLPPPIQIKAIEKIKIFKDNAFNPTLRTHSLSGREKEVWAFWIDYHYRIKFIFLNSKEVLFLEAGTHGIYK